MAFLKYFLWLLLTVNLVDCLHVNVSSVSRRQTACDVPRNSRADCYPEAAASEAGCHARNCCWRMPPDGNPNEPWCYKAISVLPASAHCDLPDVNKADCHPEGGANEAACRQRGCCWHVGSLDGIAACYYPPSDKGYTVTAGATSTSASIHRSTPTHWINEIRDLHVNVYKETAQRLRFKVTDPANKRWEVPLEVPASGAQAGNTDYDVRINNSPFGIVVTRKSTHSVLFDSSITPLVYTDQFIQVSTSLPTHSIYGLGEHQRRFLISPVNSPTKLAFWALDHGVYHDGNSYGTHPFYIGIEDDGNAFGVFFLNSNAMAVDVIPSNPPMVTFKTIGGIIDFYIFTGPKPDDVIQQYTDVIGKPYLPPYWSLGYHLSRWNYGGDAGLSRTIKRMRDARMPWDTQWTDIDYMDGVKDFTYDHKNFAHLPDVVKDLHAHGQKFVMIIDPGISSTQPVGTYPPYDQGVQQDIFIKKDDGSILIGQVWPGNTAFPDFTNPKTEEWWYQQANNFHKQVPFDGIWIDMNEVSNFVKGSTTGCTGSKLDNPPFVPPVDGGLIQKTLCSSSKQHLSTHYNLHNMYGFFEAKVTNSVLKRITNKRPFVLSRSTYAGSGKFTSHWEGDNGAVWDHLEFSIPEILSFNLFGVPTVGPDICGFGGHASDELCTRWMQVGAFYPFMRTHKSTGIPDQDPAAFNPQIQDIMRNALLTRYRLLPYLYTLIFYSHTKGIGVARPLSFQYPRDKNARGIDTQFLWGQNLLISPVVHQGKTSVDAYIPVDTWYDFYTGAPLTQSGKVTLPAPLDKINVHIRGGGIIPTQDPDITTAASRQKDFGLLVALSAHGDASGDLVWDDGESLDSADGGKYNLITFHATASSLRSTVTKSGYPTKMTLGTITIYGAQSNPAHVVVNGNAVTPTYDAQHKALHLIHLNVNLLAPLTVTWS